MYDYQIMTNDRNKFPKWQASNEDKALFRQTVHQINNGTALKTLKMNNQIDQTQKIVIHLDDNLLDHEIVTSEQTLYFARSGIQKKRLKKMKKGHYKPQAILDLHGLTLPEARAETQQFLTNAYRKHYQWIMIIHGKGLSGHHDYPIIKNYVNHWLQQLPWVLAFVSAPPNKGGSGAVYVLLKMTLSHESILAR